MQIDQLRALLPGIRARRDEIERARRLPLDLVDDLRATGVFRMCLPADLGGAGVDPLTQVQVIEEVSRADGSTGWSVMIGAGTAVLSGHLPAGTAAEIHEDPDTITAGVVAPSGMAVAEDGGYRLSGRWSFASGIEHASWVVAGCLVVEDGSPRLLAGGVPDLLLLYLPAGEVEIHDTWDVSGLCGTGSHDFSVEQAFVPAERALRLFSLGRPRPDPVYAIPLLSLLSPQVASVALGIARAALDEVTELARDKVPAMSRQRLAERPMVQADLARAEARLRSARAFVLEALGEVWSTVVAGEEVSVHQRALTRAAAAHAAATAAGVVDTAYTAGGGSALYARSPLQRHLRDVHAVTQHIAVAPQAFEVAGRLLLGLDPGTPMF